MRWINSALAWLRAVMRRGATEREMQREMAEHLALAGERLMARGLSPDEARIEARREFGAMSALQEEARDARGGRWVEATLADLRHACRHYARTPVMTLTIVLTLVIGISTNIAMVAAVRAVAFRPPPGVPNDPALVYLQPTGRFGLGSNSGTRQLSLGELGDYHALPAFADVAGWTRRTVTVATGPSDTEGIAAEADFVTPNYFAALGIPLAAGTGFTPPSFAGAGEPQATVVISNTYWRASFGGGSDAVGRSIRVNGQPMTIVGVAPPRFNGAASSDSREKIWVPLSALPIVDPTMAGALADYGAELLDAVARLAPGVSMTGATSAVHLVEARAAERRPTGALWMDEGTRLLPVNRPFAAFEGGSDDIALGVAIALLTVLVLLACCATVASLLVGAAVGRRHEIGVRLSLGASRGRVVRQLLTEATLLSLLGGLGGLGLHWLVASRLGPVAEVDLSPDGWSIAMVAGLAVATALLCGLSPAVHATRADLSTVLKGTGRGTTSRSRLQRTLVVTQIVLTQPLLVGLATLIAVLAGTLDLGGTPAGDRVLRLRLASTQSRGAVEREETARLTARLAALPGVVAVIPDRQLVTYYRFLLGSSGQGSTVADPAVEVRVDAVAPGYFEIFEIPVLDGRTFTERDFDLDEEPLIVSDAFAKRAWGNASAIGRRVRSVTKDATAEWVVIGVIDGRRAVHDAAGGEPEAFRVWTTDAAETFLIRTVGPAAALAPTVGTIARAEVPRRAIVQLQTRAEIERARNLTMIRATGAAAGGAALALVLAAIGLYAVVALGVAQRSREIGLRIALGATPRQAVLLFFNRGIALAALGVALGLPLSVAALKVVAGQMGEADVSGLVAGATVALSVMGVAALASWLPARRAAGADPVVALRSD